MFGRIGDRNDNRRHVYLRCDKRARSLSVNPRKMYQAYPAAMNPKAIKPTKMMVSNFHIVRATHCPSAQRRSPGHGFGMHPSAFAAFAVARAMLSVTRDGYAKVGGTVSSIALQADADGRDAAIYGPT
jgi:hypothetical protein